MKILKWIGVIFGSLIVLAGLAVVSLYLVGAYRLNNAPKVEVRSVAAARDAASLSRGQHLSNIGGCASCHGNDFGGKVLLDDDTIGYLPAPNLTTGAGGLGANYTDEDFARAIRHGVGKNGRALGAMPSQNLAHMSDADLSALLGYLRSVPAVDSQLGPRKISFSGTIIFGMLAYNDLAVNAIDHAGVGSPGAMFSPVSSSDGQYGEYLVNIANCKDCHGASLDGNVPPGGPPPGPGLTKSARLAIYSEEDFFRALRSGRAPGNRQLSEEMPWAYYAGMSDNEVRAIYSYLSSLP
jgi:mono/diheme cytochrome c family protein